MRKCFEYDGDFKLVSSSTAPADEIAENAVSLVDDAVEGVVQVEKVSGSYLLEFQSGKFYAGKGLELRMKKSINRIETNFGDKLIKKNVHTGFKFKRSFHTGV